MRDIALTGLARAGKDSVAARLVDRWGYVRVAFADRLKEAALKADPFLDTSCCFPTECCQDATDYRLSDAIRESGWETAKDTIPEVRRFLQDYGQTVREIDPMFWIRAAGDAVRAAHADGRPVVVTDVRYVNEAEYLAVNGFKVVRVRRPGQTPGDHISEREMASYDVDHTIVNAGSLEDLAALADGLALTTSG
jgi:hypothetical protein